MNMTILVSICKWVDKNLKIGEHVTELSNNVLKSYLWTPLKKRLSNFFSTEEETKEFIEKITDEAVEGTEAPYLDVEKVYTEITGKDYPEDFWSEIIKCFTDKMVQLNNVAQTIPSFNIGTQNVYGGNVLQASEMDFHFGQNKTNNTL